MTRIDKIIIKCLVVILIGSLITGLYFNSQLTLRIISVALGFVYFFFIMFHIALLTPLIGIVFWVNNFIELYFDIRGASKVLHYFIVTIGCLVVGIIVYLFIPLVIAMLFNNSLDINLALEAYKTIGQTEIK